MSIYLIEINSYELLPQGGGEKKFSDRPLEGGDERALNFEHLFHCHFGVPYLFSLSVVGTNHFETCNDQTCVNLCISVFQYRQKWNYLSPLYKLWLWEQKNMLDNSGLKLPKEVWKIVTLFIAHNASNFCHSHNCKLWNLLLYKPKCIFLIKITHWRNFPLKNTIHFQVFLIFDKGKGCD